MNEEVIYIIVHYYGLEADNPEGVAYTSIDDAIRHVTDMIADFDTRNPHSPYTFKQVEETAWPFEWSTPGETIMIRELTLKRRASNAE